MSRSSFPTRRQVILRLLLRGIGKDSSSLSVGGCSVMVVGPADPMKWPPRLIKNGDVEGVTWVEHEDSVRIAASLRHAPGVIDVRVELAD